MDLWSLQIPATVSLAVVAALGYLVGRRANANKSQVTVRSKHDIRKARSVARELERIASMLRKGLAQHHSRLSKFRQRVSQLSAHEQEAGWKDLCRETEEMLVPTLRLATQVGSAYDTIRQQSDNLTALTEVRADPLTGVLSRSSLEEALRLHFAMFSRHEMGFSVLIVEVDHLRRANQSEGHPEGDQLLQRTAQLLDESAREVDVVARYDGDEFVVVLPQTDLEAVSVFGERIRAKVEQELQITVSVGVTAALDGDTAETLLARAGAALSGAKEAGGNRVFRHDGAEIEAILEEAPEPSFG